MRNMELPANEAAPSVRPKPGWVKWTLMGAVSVAIIAVLVFAKAETPVGGAKLAKLSDDTVVATLGTVSAPYPKGLREAAARVREAPEDRAAALSAAQQYLDYGHEVGDARFAGAALGALQPWLEKAPDGQVLNLAAGARQYMHDFSG